MHKERNGIMDILFEDEYLLVVNKPSGLAVQTKNLSEKSLETEAKKFRKSKGEKPEIYIVHRLDQPVSGLMVLAKDSDSAGILSKGLQGDDFAKIYKARAFKTKEPSAKGVLCDYLIKDAKANASRVAESSEAGAKKAELDFEVIENSEKEVLFKVHLHTGRHHQIRVQFANAGFPLLGDSKYGTKDSIAYSQERGYKNVALKSCHLEFIHPKSKKKMSYDID